MSRGEQEYSSAELPLPSIRAAPWPFHFKSMYELYTLAEAGIRIGGRIMAEAIAERKGLLLDGA